MNEKLSISLPSVLVAILQEQVDSGRYESISDVVRAALEQQAWGQTETEEQIAHMRGRTQHSLANLHPTRSLEEMRTHLDDYITQLYKEH